MSPALLNEPVQLTCGHCGKTLRVRSLTALKPGTKGTCPGCQHRFHVLDAPIAGGHIEQSASPDAADPLAPQDQHSPITAAKAAERSKATPAAPSDASSADAAPAPMPQPSRFYRLSFHGAGGSLFGIHIVNVCLTVLTLTFYSFWAKVRIRQYLYSHTQFAGDRFAYHGTGRELLNGMTKATLVFGLPYLALSNAPLLLGGSTTVIAVSQILSTLLAMIFLPVAIVGARRYRLSRSSWRNIRFAFHGQAVEFMKLYVPRVLLTLVTLGAYYPLFDMRRQAYLIRHSGIGSRRFTFDGEDWGVVTDFMRAVLLFPFTLGLSWWWYAAARQRYTWNHTSLDGARFTCTMTGGDLAKLRLGNFFLLVCTLGFAWPWTAVRNAEFTLRTLSLTGVVDFDRITQEGCTATATGEGLSSFLDSGFDLG